MTEPSPDRPPPAPRTSSGMTAGKLVAIALSGIVLAIVGCGTFAGFSTSKSSLSQALSALGGVIFVGGAATFVIAGFGAVLMILGEIFRKKR